MLVKVNTHCVLFVVYYLVVSNCGKEFLNVMILTASLNMI